MSSMWERINGSNMECMKCDGTGIIHQDEYLRYVGTGGIACDMCKGSGEIQESKEINSQEKSYSECTCSLKQLIIDTQKDKITTLESEAELLKCAIKETRKFMNRLPSDWFSERIAALLDDRLDKGSNE